MCVSVKVFCLAVIEKKPRIRKNTPIITFAETYKITLHNGINFNEWQSEHERIDRERSDKK